MTRTSKALKRLGVVGLTVATIGAGVPAFFATTAQAAVPPTALSIAPPAQTGAAGTCLNYTITATDAASQPSAGATITVTLTPAAATTTTPAQDVDFCAATNGTSTPAPSTPSNVTNGGAGAPDQGTFITDSTGKVTFGAISTQAGTTNIQAFYDANGNGTFTNGEPQSQATATWGAGGAPGTNAQADIVRCVDATPESATNVVGETHTFQALLTTSSTTGSPSTSATQDSGTATCTGNVVPGVAPTFNVTGSTTNLGPLSCGQSNNQGIATCSYTRSAVSTDSIAVFVNQSTGGTGGQDTSTAGCAPTGQATPSSATPCEPGDTISKTWIAAQSGNTVAVVCGPNTGTNTGSGAQGPDTTTGSNTGGGTSTCTNQNTDGSRLFTATVKNTATTPVVQQGILVRFTVAGDATPATYDCTTDSAGQCSVLITDADPLAGEKQTVTATIRGTSSSGSATLTFTNSPTDARNIALTPKSQNVTPGSGVGSVTALVTDVDGAPVPNVEVTFSESGPGRFVNTAGSSTTVTTDANGKATVEVSSLASESGTQTLTATIAASNGTTQCTAAAGKDQSGTALTGTRAAAKAGNCSDTATVTYGAASPTPSGGSARPTLSTSTPDIQPNIQGIYTATGASPNSVLELRCYTRPSTTYFTARSTTVNATGGPVEFRILPGANTRCYARPAGNDALASNSVVINVHTTLSLSTVRTGVRTYIFQGRNLPRRAGQLITLYRITSSGQEIRTSNLTTDSSGIYRVTRKFTGTGTFRFRVRTTQTLNNAAGASNIITVNIH
jgi:hypothetical protein